MPYQQKPAAYYPQRNPINPTQQRDAITNALMSIARPQPQVRMPMRQPMTGNPLMSAPLAPQLGGPPPTAAPAQPQQPMPMGAAPTPNPMQMATGMPPSSAAPAVASPAAPTQPQQTQGY